MHFFFARALKGWTHVWWFDGHISFHTHELATLPLSIPQLQQNLTGDLDKKGDICYLNLGPDQATITNKAIFFRKLLEAGT
jgi:hypothetical protein